MAMLIDAARALDARMKGLVGQAADSIRTHADEILASRFFEGTSGMAWQSRGEFWSDGAEFSRIAHDIENSSKASPELRAMV